MAVVKAKREKIWIKGFLSSPSGCGKSYSSLRVAKGEEMFDEHERLQWLEARLMQKQLKEETQKITTYREAYKHLNEAEVLDLCNGNNKDRQAINLALQCLEFFIKEERE